MSDILNHYYCAREIYKLLHNNKNIINIIDTYFDAYRLGTQGPDFFYYNILSQDAHLSHKVGSVIHSENVNQFFHYGIKFSEIFPEYKDITLAYLMGFICHYELDTITHPFIFYRTGTNSNNPEEISKSKLLHKFYEVLLDTAMMQYEYSKLAVNLNPEKVFYVKPYTMEFLEKFYQYILKEVYGISLSEKSIKYSLLCAGFLINQFKDQSGIKHKFVKPFEKLIKRDKFISRFFYPSYTNEFDVLNLDQQEWLNPETGEVSNFTYPELFNQAVHKGADRIISFFKLINDNQATLENIDNLFENRSYLTGLNAREGKTNKFFDEKFKQNLLDNY